MVRTLPIADTGLGAHARGDIGDQDGDQHEEEERRDVGRIGDGEGVDRRQEEEIVAQRRRDAGQQRRPQAEANRHAHHRREEHQIDVLDAEPWLDQFGGAEADGHDHQRHQIGPRIERLRSFSRAHGLLWNRLRREFLAGDHIDADIAGAPHQIVHHRAAHDFEPPRARRLADDDLGHVIGVREADHVVGDAASDAGNGERLAAQRLRQPQRVGKPVALLVGQLQAAPRLDADRGPGRVQPVRQPLGVAHQARRARILADANQDALARGPGAGDRVGLHVREQLLVDPLGGAPQRQLAQRGQIARREIMLQRALGLLGDIDLAFLEPLNQVVRREVDQLDGIGAVEHRIRHGLAHPHMGDLRHHVVEAFDVLDVDRGIDVDAVRQQFLDVEVALGMPAAGCVGVGELIDQRDLRTARDQRVEIHLLENLVLVFEPLARQNFEALQQRFRLRPPVGLDHADHDIGAGLQFGMRALQHLIGLADAGGGADENLEPAGLIVLSPRGFQQRIRRGSFFRDRGVDLPYGQYSPHA